MKNKACYDKPEVAMVMRQCNKNYTEGLMAKRPSDVKICGYVQCYKYTL